MPIKTLQRETLALNIFPAAAAIAVLIVGVIGAVSLKADRAAPLTFIDGHVLPDPAPNGSGVIVRWNIEWYRRCEGELSRQLIGSDGIVRAYQKRFIRVPVNTGKQFSDTRFTLPPSLPEGATTYEGLIRFRDCGLTSRLWPLEVKVPALTFMVVR